MFESSPSEITEQVLAEDRRVLIFGEPGVGKSTLAASLARCLTSTGRRCWCIGADPGTPAFGIPGAVCLGEWQGENWQLLALEALCTLDAGRFRLPLVASVRRLVARTPVGMLLIDAPGVVRGVAGAELLTALVEAAGVEVVLLLVREGKAPPLSDELRALDIEVRTVRAARGAQRPGPVQRARYRTRLWDACLQGAEERHLPFESIALIGTPPPREATAAWQGRQVALLDARRTVAMGEVTAVEPAGLRVRMTCANGGASFLLVRDAQRTADGLLQTAQPWAAGALDYVPPPDVLPRPGPGIDSGPRPLVRMGLVTAALINGVFGDPLLYLRLRQQRRCLLFDLGEAGRLPARLAHQVSDVFVSHAHIDHIGGFMWLLRSRIADLPPCRLFGPPGLAGHIAGMVNGVTWDRIGERGPRFEIGELHGETLVRFRVQAGRAGCERLGERAVREGLLLEEPAFRVRAATLDHGTPVLAFAFEPALQVHVRKERLIARGLPPGPWLAELKQGITEGDTEAEVLLPDGGLQSVGALAEELLLIAPGEKLVYATDLADTADNRVRLTQLARNAHTFFCEAPFIETDADQAARTGHLTARACGEIATAAKVERLVPFHFSRRYETGPRRVYEEVLAACARAVMPRGWIRDT